MVLPLLPLVTTALLTELLVSVVWKKQEFVRVDVVKSRNSRPADAKETNRPKEEDREGEMLLEQSVERIEHSSCSVTT